MKTQSVIWGILIIVLAIVVLLGTAMWFYGAPQLMGSYGMMPMRPMMQGYGAWMPMWGGGFMLLFGLLIISAVIGLVVWLARSNTPTPTPTSLDIVKLRFAKGEITKEQFDAMRQALQA